MRTLGFCIAGIVAALLMVDYGAAGNGGRLIATALQTGASEQSVVRERKGDRLPAAAVVRPLPAAPAVRDAPQPNPVTKPQPVNQRPALLQGCEPALSPLTGAAPNGLHARCVAAASTPTRVG